MMLLALNHSHLLTLIHLDDVLALVESLTLVDVDPLNDVLAHLNHSRLLMLIHLDVLALVESLAC